MNRAAIGRLAFIIGIVIAILAGFTKIPSLSIILFVLGLIVGFLNISEKESVPFLVAVATLLLVGLAGGQLRLVSLSPVIASILGNFIALTAAAGLVVAIKQVLNLGRPQS